MNIKNYSTNELESLCGEIREEILRVVSKNGGHLSSTLGATELIVAMHKVFDSKKDPFIFDVSHQSYAHKLLQVDGKSLIHFVSLMVFVAIQSQEKVKMITL